MSSNPPAGTKPASKSVSGEDVRGQITSRFYRALNYLSVYLFIIRLHQGLVVYYFHKN